MAKNHEYSEVDSADAESLLCHSSDSVDTSIRIQRNNPTPNWPTISLIITLIFTHVLFAGLTGFATFWWARHEQTPLDKVCAVHTSQICKFHVGSPKIVLTFGKHLFFEMSKSPTPKHSTMAHSSTRTSTAVMHLPRSMQHGQHSGLTTVRSG